MICKRCAIAGDLNTLIHDDNYMDERPPAFHGDAFKIVIQLHESCRKGTHCDCQHKIEGKFIRDEQNRIV